MITITNKKLNEIVICPICKKKVRQGEMMCGTKKPMCKDCYCGKD